MQKAVTLSITSVALILICAFAVVTNSYAQAPQAAPTPREYQLEVTLNPIDNKYADDAQVTALLAPYSAKVKEQMGVIIGQAPDTINKEGIAGGALGRLMTDIFRTQAEAKLGHKIDLSFQNNGGIRAEIPGGDITVGTMFRLMPFENELAVIELKGSDLMELFKSMASNIENFGAAVSGAELVYDEHGLVSAQIHNQDVKADGIYTMVVSDYLYSGGGEYPILQRGKNYQAVGLLLREALINYVRAENAAGRKITAPETPRVKLIKDTEKEKKAATNN